MNWSLFKFRIWAFLMGHTRYVTLDNAPYYIINGHVIYEEEVGK